MACHIYDLCTKWKDWLISQQRYTAYQFLNILKAEKFQIFSPNSKLTEAQLVQLIDVSVLQKTKWLWNEKRGGGVKELQYVKKLVCCISLLTDQPVFPFCT
jgi:hypothetical protein